jgi:hypothetical protein
MRERGKAQAAQAERRKELMMEGRPGRVVIRRVPAQKQQRKTDESEAAGGEFGTCR